jgi:TM2 domain-containing membrane protein YozV
MDLDNENISKKSPLITLILCLIFGSVGAHRFYVSKYITGIIYFIIGSTSIILDLFGYGYAFILKIIYMLLIIIDLYALYSESFTDAKGRIISSSEKYLIYETYEERDQKIFIDKLNKLVVILLAIAAYITYIIISTFMF